MRRFVVLAALVAAGCQVELEGAKCETDAHCPGDQACGLDGACSARAAACRDARDTPGVKRCKDGVITVFVTTSDPVCGTWEPVETCAEGLVCAEGIAACACAPVADGAFHFDPARQLLEDFAPTGAAEPAACRLATLEEALARAAVAGPGSRAVAAGPPATYALPTEGLTLPAGVSLTTVTPDEPSHVLEIPALTGTEPAGVRLGAGSTLEGFTIRNVGATAGVAIRARCDVEGLVSLATVSVVADGVAGRLDDGVRVEGACDFTATDLVVSGAGNEAGNAALFVATEPARSTRVERGQLTASQEGVHLRSGKLALRAVEVSTNEKMGVVAGVSAGGSELELVECTISGNGDTGLVLFNNSRLTLIENEITNNRAVTLWGGRNAGGIVFRTDPPPSPAAGAPPTLVFHGNRMRANDGDQALVYGATKPWNLDGGDCSALRNEFSCYATGWVGLSAIDSVVSARYASWPRRFPRAPDDFLAVGSGDIDAGSDVIPELSCAAAPVCGTALGSVPPQ